MKRSLGTISPYYEAFNISDARQVKILTLQLRRYFHEQAQEIDRWVKAVDGAPVSLRLLERRLYERFGVTSQALRYFGECERQQGWERSKSATIGHALAFIQSDAMAGRLDVRGKSLERLGQVDENCGQFLNVTTDPAARRLRPLDFTGWERILTGSYEAGRVVNGLASGTGEEQQAVLVLTSSQRELHATLKAHWSIKQRGVTAAGYDLRPIPLIVGPSGSGKSALVRYFASVQKLPMKDFNVGTWIVTGAKAEPPTLGAIGDFIEAHERGVLFLDEVDKLIAVGDWTRSIQQEIYALLDGRTDSFPGWSRSIRKKFARDFFLVGAGTWQTHYSGRRRALGFGASRADDAWTIELDEQDEIPEELLMRFNADVLYLRSLTSREFADRIALIHAELGVPCPRKERLHVLVGQAVASGRHNRWLEAYASRLLRCTM